MLLIIIMIDRSPVHRLSYLWGLRALKSVAKILPILLGTQTRDRPNG
jgi:hypothetical protein